MMYALTLLGFLISPALGSAGTKEEKSYPAQVRRGKYALLPLYKEETYCSFRSGLTLEHVIDHLWERIQFVNGNPDESEFRARTLDLVQVLQSYVVDEILDDGTVRKLMADTFLKQCLVYTPHAVKNALRLYIIRISPSYDFPAERRFQAAKAFETLTKLFEDYDNLRILVGEQAILLSEYGFRKVGKFYKLDKVLVEVVAINNGFYRVKNGDKIENVLRDRLGALPQPDQVSDSSDSGLDLPEPEAEEKEGLKDCLLNLFSCCLPSYCLPEPEGLQKQPTLDTRAFILPSDYEI